MCIVHLIVLNVIYFKSSCKKVSRVANFFEYFFEKYCILQYKWDFILKKLCNV